MTSSATTPQSAPTPITVARGDGIGPEIMDASLAVLEAAGARLAIEEIEVGEKVYRQGISTGIPDAAWDSLRRTHVLYKAPITTPQGGGYKSLNVTLRKSLGLFANVRPCVAYAPFVSTRHPGMNVVIVRENEEDLYGGIEYRVTDEVFQSLKVITRAGCERIVRYAFDYARAHGRRRVTCMTKDNIMKLTDGQFHKVFDEVAPDYPEIEAEHLIIDIGTARLAARPERFDVIVTPNLYGDIISDVAAEITGSVGLAPSANIGRHGAMFEAIHGSAPDIAGQGIANPSGLLLAGVTMLTHIGQQDVAERIHNAWLTTIEDGVHTGDIFTPDISRERVGTRAFAEAVIARLGRLPTRLPVVSLGEGSGAISIAEPTKREPAVRRLVGVDVYVQETDPDAEKLAGRVEAAADGLLPLVMISNRGMSVWPRGAPEAYKTDEWRCRFEAPDGGEIDRQTVIDLLSRLAAAGIDFVMTELLHTFDGERGFSLGQGQ